MWDLVAHPRSGYSGVLIFELLANLQLEKDISDSSTIVHPAKHMIKPTL